MKLLYFLLVAAIFCQIPSSSSDSNTEQDSDYSLYNDSNSNDEETSYIPLYLIIGFLASVSLVKCFKKILFGGAEKNSDSLQNKMDKFLKEKIAPTPDIYGKLDSFLSRFEAEKIEMSYLALDKWHKQEIKQLNISKNQDVLIINITGSDKYGGWTQKGAIAINNEKQISCLMNKVYEDQSLQGRDILFYVGKYNEKLEQFNGEWYYEQSGDKGKWQMNFIKK